jgi:Asp-tRNA(Asn)/Glu-tRNA(Gln) amidotransferase C subunit
MKDWKAIAKASGLEVDDTQLNRIAETLEALETAFHPLLKDLTPDVEPATGLRLEEDAE